MLSSSSSLSMGSGGTTSSSPSGRLNNMQLSWPANRPGRWGRGLGCYGRCFLLLMLLHPTSNVGIQADAKLPELLIAEALPFCATTSNSVL